MILVLQMTTSQINMSIYEFSGNLVNIFENENLVDVNGINTVDGNENIYSRGEGIITTLDLFSGSLINDNGEEISEFDHFKDFFYDNISDSPKRLINEAYRILCKSKFHK